MANWEDAPVKASTWEDAPQTKSKSLPPLGEQASLIPGVKPLPAPEETTVTDEVKGAGEAALSVLTGTVGTVIGGVKGVLSGVPAKEGEKIAAETAAKFTYAPKTEAGQEDLDKINSLIESSGLAGMMPGVAAELPAISETITAMRKPPVNPTIAEAVKPKVPDTITPASSYDGMAEFRAETGIKAMMKSAAQQDKIQQARAVLDKYPEVQAATTGNAAKVRKQLEGYMKDPEVIDLIKKAQDTRLTFEEASPTVTPEWRAGAGVKNATVATLRGELNNAIAAGESHTTLKAIKARLDNALSDFYFPGVSREEAQGWIDDMRTRQKATDEFIAKEEEQPKDIINAVMRGNRLSLKRPITEWDYRGKADERMIMQDVGKLQKLAPDEPSQQKLFSAMEDPTKQKEPEVQEARKLFDKVWQAGNEAGVVKDWVENYITHMYDYGTQSTSKAMENFRKLAEEISRAPTSGMGVKSRFGDKRIFKTYEDAAKHAGLKPLTTNPAELYQIYASSMLKAANNKRFVADLKDVVNPATGEKLLQRIGKGGDIPRGYETINHPQFAGYAIAKDIAPTLRSMFENPASSTILSGSHLVSMMAKKGIFSLSAFHIKSLMDALIGALRSPSTIAKLPSIFKQWKDGDVGDVVDLALKGGLEIGHMPLDVHADVLRGVVDDISRSLDKVFPKLGGTVRVPVKGVELLNDFLWKYVHPSFKLAIWSQEHQRLVSKGMDPIQASEMAATYTNDIFGGLNWRRIAENTDSYLGYRMANEAASRGGQRAMQIALQAPDWTVATARSWEGAFRRGANPAERSMYQRYLLQSGLIYLGVANLLNEHFTGHAVWQNEDPTMVDMGDGRKLQLSKHFMEVPHWFLHPNQTLLNKMGFMPGEIFRQALNQDYLSASGAAPKIVEKGTSMPMEIRQRAEHMLKQMTPITLGTAAEKSPREALASGLGFPVYGDTPEQKAARKLARQLKMEEIRRKMQE